NTRELFPSVNSKIALGGRCYTRCKRGAGGRAMVESVLDAGGGVREIANSDENLLQAIWGALTVARENKALIVAQAGVIIRVNELAEQLCDRTQDDLFGCAITQLLSATQALQPGRSTVRWETELKAASGLAIPVEVTYQPLRSEL